MNPTEYSQKTKIKKRFLIASIDESIVNRPLFVVLAQDGAAALQIFLRRIVSREPVFRAWVMNLAANMSFVEQFYVTTDLERERLQSEGIVGTELEIVRSRISSYFGEQTGLCDLYIRYMETEDKLLLTNELFEFISEKQGPREHGLVAVDIDDIDVIE